MTFGLAWRPSAALIALFALLALAPAASAAPPIETYGKLPGFERAAMSPSGAYVALIGVVGDERSLLVIDRDNKPVLRTGVGKLKVRDVTWGGDDRVLVRMSATVGLGLGFIAAKTELHSMQVVPLNGDKPWAVFAKDRDISGGIRGYYGSLERDGRWYGYFGGITLARGGTGENYLGSTAAELYEVDLASGHSTRIAARLDADESYRNWLIGADGKVAARLDYHSRNGAWTIRNARNAPIASGRNPLGGVRLSGLGREPDTIAYFVEDESTGVDHLMEVTQDGSKTTEILNGIETGRLYFDPKSRLLIGYLEESDSPVPHFFDRRREKVVQGTRKALPGLNVDLLDWNDAFDMLLVKTDGTGDAGTWWIVDIKTGAANPIGYSYPINESDVGPVSVIRYKAADGLDLTGILTLPPGRSAKACRSSYIRTAVRGFVITRNSTFGHRRWLRGVMPSFNRISGVPLALAPIS